MTTATDRVAVVTGGAGGIGSAISRRLARSGASVVVTYNERGERAEELVASLGDDGRHLAVRAPVDDASAVDALHGRLADRFGRVDVLVNNAGVTRPVAHDDLSGLDDELIDEIFRVNWRGAFAMVRALRPLLVAGGDGVVVNVSSVAAVTGLGSNVAYSASKAAMDSMTRSLAHALAPAIRVVSVSPGWVLGEYASTMPPSVLESQRLATPSGRLSTAEDVASAVTAVVDLLPQTTGAVIPVDGGRPLGS